MTDQNELITVEFHCHTVFSHDSSNQILELIKAAREKGIQRLAITDHNTIRGALEAHAIAPDLIIVGEEILTSEGEIIGYYMAEEIPRGLSPLETIARLKAQGAFIAVPHPMDRLRHGWNMDELKRILPHVDALETFNARSLSPELNHKASELAKEWGIKEIGGSDAHTLLELGLVRTRLPEFNNADELREAALEAETNGRLLSPGDHFKTSMRIGLRRINGYFGADGKKQGA